MFVRRWLSLLLILVVINAVAVLSSSIWHFTVAAEQNGSDQAEDQTSTDSATTRLQLPHKSSGNRRVDVLKHDAPGDLPAGPPSPIRQSGKGSVQPSPSSLASPLPGLDSATEGVLESGDRPLAEIPSLATEQDLERDPVFREFQRMFSESGRPDEFLSEEVKSKDLRSADLLSDATQHGRTEQYFKTLRDRLTTAQELSGAAQRIADEAAELHRAGKQTQADQLLRMIVQLREVAAELLVLEL